MHVLSDDSERPYISLEEAYDEAGYKGEGIFQLGEEVSSHDTQLVCGHFEFEEMFNHPLIDAAIIKRLSEVIFIQAVRSWYQTNQNDSGFIAALNDPQISKGLNAFHQDYAGNWTVQKLAEASGMSRSLFSDKFKNYLGLSPMQYVTHWRMQNAKQLLRDKDISNSVPSFSKAFKRILGKTPGEYRRLIQAQAA